MCSHGPPCAAAERESCRQAVAGRHSRACHAGATAGQRLAQPSQLARTPAPQLCSPASKGAASLFIHPFLIGPGLRRQVKSAEAEAALPGFDFGRRVGRKIALQKFRRSIVLMVVDVADFDGSLPRQAIRCVGWVAQQVGGWLGEQAPGRLCWI